MLFQRAVYSLFFVTVISCSQKTPQQHLVDFVNDPENKIKQSIQIGDVKVVVKLLPDSYRNTLMGADKDDLDDGFMYFSIRLDNGKVEKVTNERKLYLDFDMQNDFTLLCDNDSIGAAICQRVENGIAGSHEYLLAFENGSLDDTKNDFTLFYEDKIFGVGTVAFVFTKEDISKIPSL